MFWLFCGLDTHRFTAFLRAGMRTSQIQHRGVQSILHRLNATLPHAFQATIPAPLAKMVIDRPPTNFSDRWCRWVSFNRQFLPLATRMQSVQNIVEDLVQRDFAHIPAFCRSQTRQNFGSELFFSYTGRDSALRCLPLARFFSDDALSPPFS